MIRHALRGLLNAVVLLLVVMIGALALIQTGPGKRILADRLSSLLSSPGTGVEITGIQGWVPLDMQIEALTLTDGAGAWLTATNVKADWSPSALFLGQVQIDAIGAEHIQVARPPLIDEPKPKNTEPFRLPELPGSLPPITLKHLSVPRFDLEAAVLGEAASFELNGSLTASADGREADLTLDLQRLDEPTAFATLISTISLTPATLAIDLDASETGGLLARITGRPDAGDLDLSLTGKGPVDGWSGRLDIAAGGLGMVEAGLALALLDQPRIEVSGFVQPAPTVLPDDFREIVGERLALDVAIVQTEAQALNLERLELLFKAASLRATGALDFDREDLTFKTELDAPDLSPLSDLAGVALGGEAGVTIDVAGSFREPSGRLDYRIQALQLDDLDIADIVGGINWQTVEPLTSPRPSFELAASGTVQGLRIPETPLPDSSMAWTADLIAPLGGTLTVRDAVIETAESTLTATGSIDPQSLISALDLELEVPKLVRLAEPYGQDLDGEMVVSAAITSSRDAKTVAIDLDAGLDGLTGLPPGAAELLGDKVTLQAGVGFDDGQRLSIDDLAVNGANTALAGHAGLDLESEALTGNLALALPRLQAMAALIEQDIDGAADLTVELGGDLGSPLIDATLTSEALDLMGETIEALSLKVTGEDLVASPDGTLRLDLNLRSLPLDLAFDYRLAEHSLQLDSIALNGPETTLTGQLVIDRETALIEGALEGKVKDLAALKPIHDQPLAGALDLRADLSSDDARQDAVLSAVAEELVGSFGKIDKVSLEGALGDLLGRPEIEAKALVAGLAQDGLNLSRLSLDVDGDLEHLTLDLKLDGQASKPFSLNALGGVSLAEPYTLTVEQMSGAFADEPIRLARPLTASFADDVLSATDLDLRLGGASLKGNVDINSRQASGDLKLRAAPLTWLERFDGPALTGSLSADLGLGGTSASPRIEILIKASDLHSKTIATEEVPPLDIQLNAKLVDGLLDTSLVADRLGKRTVTANASHPISLQLTPWALELPENGRLAGRIDAEAMLEWLADLLLLDEQTLKGHFLAKLSLGGTLSDPVIKGPIELNEGLYENNDTGTEISQVTLRATADDARIDISRLSGRVGKDGTIGGTGWIALDPNAKFPLSVMIDLQQAQLIAKDDLDAQISGRIAMSGNLANPKIDSNLTVDRAEVLIPDETGVDIPEIEVEEVGATIINVDERVGKRSTPIDPELAVDVSLPNRFYVRGRSLESEWEGKLGITGRASTPSLVGELKVKKGSFDFLDKRFDLSTGEISFGGEFPPNPIVNVDAQAKEGNFTAIFKITGAATKPTFTLTSEPALPEDQVLSRLLFNRNLSQIGAIEAGQLALALNRLRGGGGFDAFGEIRNILNIDRLDVVSDDATNDSKVKAGKYLSEDVYVEVEKGAADASGRARVELEIFPNVSVQAETGEDSVSGVDLKWRLDY